MRDMLIIDLTLILNPSIRLCLYACRKQLLTSGASPAGQVD